MANTSAQKVMVRRRPNLSASQPAAGVATAVATILKVMTQEISSYVRGIDRLLEIEGSLVREILGERKAAIIADGLITLKTQQLQGKSPTA